MRKLNLTHTLLTAALIVLVFGSGYRLGEYNAKNKSAKPYNITNIQAQNTITRDIDFSLFWDTWNKLEEKYVDKKRVDPRKMFYGAIKGLVASVNDPYTFFLTPDENKQSKNDLGGKFEGIGAQLGLKNNRIVVIAPLKGSPSEQSGIRAGDFIVKVDNQPTKDWTLPYAVSKIRGPENSKVKLTLERNGKAFDLTITRQQIIVESVELSYESRNDCTRNCSKVAYVKINQFGDNTNNGWDKAVDTIQSKWQNGQIKGLVLDLRENPGGFLDSAVYLASDFLQQGQIVVKQESIGETKEYKSLRDGRLQGISLVILIDKGSASASEILSGALHDYKKAKLVGEKSFGKGSVQEALDLKDGAGLHVTVAKWILPNGTWINGKGIEPDIKIDNKQDQQNTLTRQTDNQLEKAIEEILK